MGAPSPTSQGSSPAPFAGMFFFACILDSLLAFGGRHGFPESHLFQDFYMVACTVIGKTDQRAVMRETSNGFFYF